MPYDEINSAQQALIERVEYRVDQVTAQGQTTPINRESVYGELEEASDSVLRRAPRLISQYAGADGTADANANAVVSAGKVVIPLPADFIRFLRLKLVSWQTDVDDLVDVRTSRYRLQGNPFAQADAWAPLASQVPYFAGSGSVQALEAFPGTTGSSPVELLAYVGRTAPEDVPTELDDALIWEAAGRVLMATRQEGAGVAMEMASKAISGLFLGRKGEEIPAE